MNLEVQENLVVLLSCPHQTLACQHEANFLAVWLAQNTSLSGHVSGSNPHTRLCVSVHSHSVGLSAKSLRLSRWVLCLGTPALHLFRVLQVMRGRSDSSARSSFNVIPCSLVSFLHQC